MGLALRKSYWMVLMDNKPRVSILVEILVSVMGVLFFLFLLWFAFFR